MHLHSLQVIEVLDVVIEFLLLGLFPPNLFLILWHLSPLLAEHGGDLGNFNLYINMII